MNRVSFVLAIAAAALAALSAFLYRGLLEERAARADLAAVIGILRRQAIRWPVAERDTRVDDGPQPAQLAAVASAPESARSVASGDAAAHQRIVERFRGRLQDPAYRAATLAQYRLNIEMNHPELAAELQLTSDQADRFLDLMARQQLDQQEFNIEMNARAIAEDPGDAMAWRMESDQLIQERDRRFEAERQALLGADKYGLWREYVDSREARGQLRELRSRLAGGASPLYPQQFDQLVPLLTAEYQRYQQDVRTLYQGAAVPGDPPDLEAIWTRRVELLQDHQQRALATLGPYMDAEQLRQLRNLQAAELQRERNHLRMQLVSRELQSIGSRP